MSSRTFRIMSLGILFLTLAAVTALGSTNHKRESFGTAVPRLSEEVPHKLAALPYYEVFDNLQFWVQGTDTVILFGHVIRPTLRKDAANAVRRLSVDEVIKDIKVLPLSPNDDRIR